MRLTAAKNPKLTTERIFNMDPKQLMEQIVKFADDKKARNITVLDISELTTLTDYFVICEGGSSTQVKAIVDEVEEKLSEQGVTVHGIEGFSSADWILMDYTDVVLHVFTEQSREFFNIENLWSDAKQIDVDKILGL